MIHMELETCLEAKCRAFVPALTAAVKTSVGAWHKNVMPRHFKRGASGRYGYQKRNEKYLKYKNKRKPGRPDLVYSGYSKKILSMPMRVTASKGIVRGAFASNKKTRHFYMIPSGHPNKPAELKTLTDGEVAKMSQAVKEMTIARVDAVKTKRRIK